MQKADTMQSIFTVERRQQVLDNLITFFKADEGINGVVLVGSTAEGFADHYSDINLLLVVRNGVILQSAFLKWRERLLTLYAVTSSFEIRASDHEHHLTCLLHNSLILSLTFIKQSQIKIAHPQWKVIEDRTADTHLDELLTHAHQNDRVQAPRRQLDEVINHIWWDIAKCMTAIQRDELWRALHLLERVRHSCIELAAVHYDVNIVDDYHVDQLPEMFLVHLRHTVPTNMTAHAIRRSLRTAVLLLFGEAEAVAQQSGLESVAHIEQQMITLMDTFG